MFRENNENYQIIEIKNQEILKLTQELEQTKLQSDLNENKFAEENMNEEKNFQGKYIQYLKGKLFIFCNDK